MKVIDPDEMGLVGGLIRTFAWSYSGVKDFQHDYPRIAELSVVDYVTGDFPPTFISGGNGDPLTPQSDRTGASDWPTSVFASSRSSSPTICGRRSATSTSSI